MQTEPIRSNFQFTAPPCYSHGKHQQVSAPSIRIAGTQLTVNYAELPDFAALDRRKGKKKDLRLTFHHYPSLKNYAVVQFQKQRGANAECFCKYLSILPFRS